MNWRAYPWLATVVVALGCVFPQISFAVEATDVATNNAAPSHSRPLALSNYEFTVLAKTDDFPSDNVRRGDPVLSVDDSGNILAVYPAGGNSVLISNHSARIIEYRSADPASTNTRIISPPLLSRSGRIAYSVMVGTKTALVIDGISKISSDTRVGDYIVSDGLSSTALGCDGHFYTFLALKIADPDSYIKAGKAVPPGKTVMAVDGIIAPQPLDTSGFNFRERFSDPTLWGASLYAKIQSLSRDASMFDRGACNASQQAVFKNVRWLLETSDGGFLRDPELDGARSYVLNDAGLILSNQLDLARYQDATSASSQSNAPVTHLLPQIDFPKLLGLSPKQFLNKLQLDSQSVALNNKGQIAFYVPYVTDFYTNNPNHLSNIPAKYPVEHIAFVLGTPGGMPPAQGQPTVCSRFFTIQAQARELRSLADRLATDDNFYQNAVADMQLRGYGSPFAQFSLDIDESTFPTYFAKEFFTTSHRAAIVASIRQKATKRDAIAETGLRSKLTEQDNHIPATGDATDSSKYFCSADPELLLNTSVLRDAYDAGYVDYKIYNAAHNGIWLNRALQVYSLLPIELTDSLISRFVLSVTAQNTTERIALNATEGAILKSLASRQLTNVSFITFAKIIPKATESAEQLNAAGAKAFGSKYITEWLNGTSIQTYEAVEDFTVWRVFSEGKQTTEPVAQWLTTEDLSGLSTRAIQKLLAIPEMPTTITKIVVRKGTVFKYGLGVGGGKQIFVPAYTTGMTQILEELPNSRRVLPFNSNVLQ